MPLPRPLLAAAAALAALTASPTLAGGPQLYDFTINTPASGLSATTSFSISTAGTLIGNWDPDTNPTGTRTKPGINPFDPFGPTENHPIDVDVDASLSGPIDSAPAGAFSMALSPGSGSLSLSGLSADLLSGGPASLPLTVTFFYQGFRTRNPTSTYLGGIPIPVPFGSATLSAMTIQQLGDAAPGVLTPAGPGVYDFVVAPLVTLTATFSFLGNEFEVPGVPLPFPLAGQITLDGDIATLLSVQPISFDQALSLDVAIPQIPFPLPTILPPGSEANVLLDLVLSEIAAELTGTQTLSATGILIPAPGAAALCLAGLFPLARRRRVSV